MTFLEIILHRKWWCSLQENRSLIIILSVFTISTDVLEKKKIPESKMSAIHSFSDGNAFYGMPCKWEKSITIKDVEIRAQEKCGK